MGLRSIDRYRHDEHPTRAFTLIPKAYRLLVQVMPNVGQTFMKASKPMHQHIREWLVKLKGDLAELPSAFAFPLATIISQDGSFFLKSVTLNSIQDPREVLEEAKRLVEIINGAAKLYFDHYTKVEVANSIVGVDENGSSHQFSFGFGTGRRVNESYRDPAAIGKWLDKAEREKQVADTLRFFAAQSWVDLYKIFEIIRDDIGDSVKRGWVAKHDLTRFTQTAQSRASIGDAARHASKKFKAHKDPMSLPDARSFIKGLLLKWLDDLTQ